jgi:hypothetical protein
MPHTIEDIRDTTQEGDSALNYEHHPAERFREG